MWPNKVQYWLSKQNFPSRDLEKMYSGRARYKYPINESSWFIARSRGTHTKARDIGESTFCLLNSSCVYFHCFDQISKRICSWVEDSSSSGQYLFYWSPLCHLLCLQVIGWTFFGSAGILGLKCDPFLRASSCSFDWQKEMQDCHL